MWARTGCRSLCSSRVFARSYAVTTTHGAYHQRVSVTRIVTRPCPLSSPVVWYRQQKVRHKVVFLDVVHAAKERKGLKTRHLYPPQDLYDKLAKLSGAVVIGSCRIGGTREVDLDLLREKTVTAWAVRQTDNGVGGCRHKNPAGSICYPSGVRSVSEVLLEPGADNGGGSSDVSTSWGGSNSAQTSRRSVVTDDDLCASSKIFGSRRRSSSGRDDGDSSSNDRISDGIDRQDRKMYDKPNADTCGPQSIGNAHKYGDGGDRIKGRCNAAAGVDPQPMIAGVDGYEINGMARWTDWKRNLSDIASLAGVRVATDGDGSGTLKRLGRVLSREDATRACTPTYERAVYGEDSSIFGRAVRDALSGECIEEGFGTTRLLMVHLFSFIVRKLDLLKESTPRAKVTEEGPRDDSDDCTEFRREGAAAMVETAKAPVRGGYGLWWMKLRGETNTREGRSKESEAMQVRKYVLRTGTFGERFAEASCTLLNAAFD